MKVYLAGPVSSLSDGGKSWRNSIKERYSDTDISFTDPLSKYNVPLNNLDIVEKTPAKNGEVSVTQIVEADKQLLRQSDGILVGYSNVHSIGTPMEVQWGYERNYPIVMYVRDDTSIESLSPWYRYHCEYITDGVNDAIQTIHKQLDLR